MNRAILCSLIISFLCCSFLQGVVVVQGQDSSAPKAFETDVTTKAYNRKTGTFFVGLESGTDVYTISKATRPTFSNTPAFSAVLVSGSNLTTATIEFLAFSPQTTDRSVLATVSESSSAKTANTIIALFTDGTAETSATSALHDAGGTADSDGIVQMTASDDSIFAAVKPDGSFFGDDNTGIALVGIGATDTTLALNIKDATAGVDGNKAAELQQASTVLKGTSGGQDVVFTDTQAAMHWDKEMERLFIGLNISTNTGASDIAKAVVVGRLSSGILNLQAIAPDGAISGGGVDEIVVATGANITINPHHIGVMHTSTGPDYLILDCTTTITCNRVFALPLVNDTASPTSSTNGTLAAKDSTLNSSYKFTTDASIAGDLAVNNPTTDPEAVVGAGDLPLEVRDTISDLIVLGDAVYISISKAPDSNNDSGLWYSQALFDDEGKIIRWTPWTKRGVPLNAFPGITLPGGATHNGSIKFLEVDGKTGNIWIVEGTTEQTVGITSWNTGTVSTDMTTKIAAALTSGCYSVLDLDQATRGFLNTTAHRYALFGGTKKIVFTRTSQATNPAIASSPQSAITDYSSSENLLSTSLPDSAGCCHVLEYTRTSTTADSDSSRTNYGYFFAGTGTGLFVFADTNGNGFNSANMSTLNVAPFSNRTWQKADSITGEVVDIKTSGAGDTLYVLTFESTATAPLKSTLYSIPFAATMSAMFSSGNIRTIAQTGIGAFSNVVQFFGIQILATADPRAANPENKEQLVLATNQGLFRSNATQAGSASIATATTQTAANWQLVTESNSKTTLTTAFYGIAGMDTPVRNTSWPFSIQDQSGFSTFDRGSIHQFSGIGNSGGTATAFNTFFVPEKFNARPQSATFKTLHPIIYFFSDGGRRFFIYNRTSDPANQIKIGVLPFDVTDWNVAQIDILNNPTLENVNQIYWLKQIGATGILMAGTGTGVIGLD